MYKKFFSKHFAENRMTLRCSLRLHNYGAINFVSFFGPPCIYSAPKSQLKSKTRAGQ